MTKTRVHVDTDRQEGCGNDHKSSLYANKNEQANEAESKTRSALGSVVYSIDTYYY